MAYCKARWYRTCVWNQSQMAVTWRETCSLSKTEYLQMLNALCWLQLGPWAWWCRARIWHCHQWERGAMMALETSLLTQTLSSPGTGWPKAKVPAEQVNLTMSRVCPLATRHRRKMLWLTLGSGSWRAFVLLMLLQKSALIFQTTLEAVWCFGTPTAEQRLLHPVLNQRVHYTGKILFCINNLLEPSHVSLQSVSGTETCRVPPHGKMT